MSTTVATDGEISPCAYARSNTVLGNLYESPESAWNGAVLTKIRKNMLLGRKSPECERCYFYEKYGIESMRQFAIRKFDDYKEENLTPDYWDPIFWDVRFDNVCNFKCRMCQSNSSTSWYSDDKKLGRIPPESVIVNKKIMHYLKTTKNLRQVYIAGGEPLLSEQHYVFLQHLIDHNKTDVDLLYSTNLSVLKYKNYNVLNFWKQFKKIAIMVSVDDLEERCEYIRSGLKWDVLLKNLEIIKEVPNIKLFLCCTLGVANSFNLPNLHEYFVSRKIIGHNDLFVNYITDPASHRASTLPSKLKEKVINNYETYGNRLPDGEKRQELPDTFKNSILGTARFLRETDTSYLYNDFLNEMHILDKIRGEKFNVLFPEFS